jgi:hypothetical protein
LARFQGRQDLGVLQQGFTAKLDAQVGHRGGRETSHRLLSTLPLPLEAQVGRGDDQDPFGQPAELQLPNQEAGHDGLAGASVVGQREAHAGQLQEVVVDRFKLVGQRGHP